MGKAAPAQLHPTFLLDRVACELQHCSSILSRVENSVHDLLQHNSGADGSLPWQRNLQDIDLLAQHLADLARCLLAASVDQSLQSAAEMNAHRVLGSLHLDDLRQRLCGNARLDPSERPVEFF
jgi:hypothetical protein